MVPQNQDSQNLSLSIGPLLFHNNTPNGILVHAHLQLSPDFSHLNPYTLTELSLSHGKFQKHFAKFEYYRQWIKSYTLKQLVNLNCSSNAFIMLKQLQIFEFNNLENLILSDCQIESIQPLVNCLFPNLACLALYNNNISNLKSLRKFGSPFLSELIIDNNVISELEGFQAGWMTYLQKIQINNNLITNLVPLLRCNCSRLQEIRMQNVKHFIERYWNDTIQEKMKNKFTDF